MFRVPIGAVRLSLADGFFVAFCGHKIRGLGSGCRFNSLLGGQNPWSYGDLAVVRPPTATGSLRLQVGIATKIHEKIEAAGQIRPYPTGGTPVATVMGALYAFASTVLERVVWVKVRIRAATQRSAQATYTAR